MRHALGPSRALAEREGAGDEPAAEEGGAEGAFQVAREREIGAREAGGGEVPMTLVYA